MAGSMLKRLLCNLRVSDDGRSHRRSAVHEPTRARRRLQRRRRNTSPPAQAPVASTERRFIEEKQHSLARDDAHLHAQIFSRGASMGYLAALETKYQAPPFDAPMELAAEPVPLAVELAATSCEQHQPFSTSTPVELPADPMSRVSPASRHDNGLAARSRYQRQSPPNGLPAELPATSLQASQPRKRSTPSNERQGRPDNAKDEQNVVASRTKSSRRGKGPDEKFMRELNSEYHRAMFTRRPPTRALLQSPYFCATPDEDTLPPMPNLLPTGSPYCPESPQPIPSLRGNEFPAPPSVENKGMLHPYVNRDADLLRQYNTNARSMWVERKKGI